MADREPASIIFHFFHKYGRGFRGLKNPYFIQDNLLTPLNRIIGCKLLGHRNVKIASDPGEPRRKFCFNCYKWVKEQGDD